MTVHLMLPPEEVSKILCISLSTLKTWRMKGVGPPSIKMTNSGSVRYPDDKLAKWQAAEFDKQHPVKEKVR